jgi:DNA-binding NtrC family response regulator
MVERILEVRPGLPVAFMTGTAAEAHLPRQQSRTYKLFHKPFSPQTLLEIVRECLAA